MRMLRRLVLEFARSFARAAYLEGLRAAREAGPSRVPSSSRRGDWFNDACEEWEAAIDALIEKERTDAE